MAGYMSYLVLAYPKIKEEDYRWIQSLRREYDIRYYFVVEPHFTIVFPVFNKGKDSILNHVEKVYGDIAPIQFSVRGTTIVKDSFSDYTDVFLVPDEGNREIIKLHDKLYTGILSEELRLDIPFIPHIGVGGSKDAAEAKKISDKLNKENICITGKIEELDLVEYDYPVVKSIKKFYLH